MQGIATSVFVDANVHFSRTRRDWIGLLSTTPDDPPFHVYWTEDIVAEVIRNLRKNIRSGRAVRSPTSAAHSTRLTKGIALTIS